jgi:hypothetical protein
MDLRYLYEEKVASSTDHPTSRTAGDDGDA